MSSTTADPSRGQNWTDPVQNHDYIWIYDLSIWVANHNVTNADYADFDSAHDSGSFEGHALNQPEQPVASVSYLQAQDYADWLQNRFQEAGCSDSFVLRLPSHKEWSAFAGCGRNPRFPWGDNWPPHYGNYGDQSAKKAFPEWDCIENYDDGYIVSCPVSEAGENDWGLVGVGGNVYEWTFEADGTRTELRGASWSTFQEEYMWTENRYVREPSSALINFGIRLVIVP